MLLLVLELLEHLLEMAKVLPQMQALVLAQVSRATAAAEPPAAATSAVYLNRRASPAPTVYPVFQLAVWAMTICRWTT